MILINYFEFLKVIKKMIYRISKIMFQILIIYNRTAFNMTFRNLNAGSTAANQIRTMTGADLVTTGEGSITLIYDVNVSNWIVLSFQP